MLTKEYLASLSDVSKKYEKTLKISRLKTPLGEMLSIADEETLFFLEFADHSKLEHQIKLLMHKIQANVIPGSSKAIRSIENELAEYFEGRLIEFKTPHTCIGTPFQNSVWSELKKVSYGRTCSYADIASAIGKPTAFRAVARANGANLMPIIIPCHRIINANGDLGGYSACLSRKIWLLDHERNHLRG